MTRRTQPQPPRRLRCAIYTRKSSEEGLEQEFNSLDAQRETCEAYIASQKAEGWVCLRDKYDDGGFSGGTLERPALKDLIADIEEGLIDIVVVYKIDRLSRALMDFSKLVEIFDKHGVTFVSVTQSFNTTTSMGCLTLKILLSFAQFEREVIGERIRDKVAASRKKGIWMGGPVPLGYNVQDRKLIVDPAEAETVRTIFTLYARSSSTAAVIRELDARAILTKTGRPYDKTSLLKTLHNKVYRGLSVHKGTAYPGEHDAIIDEPLWDEVHEVIANNRFRRVAVAKEPSPALLRGLIFTETGVAMTPHHT
ncbi:MAG: recombinase family protein, partial [Allgaiera sp.]|nr:recombinase family protein [Allgaiera sp.]